MNYSLVDEELVERLEGSAKERAEYLFLEPHSEFEGRWAVNAFEPDYFYDFEPVIGPYRVVAPSTLEVFLDLAKDRSYRVAFFEDPAEILNAYAGLDEPPSVELRSDFAGVVNGFLPYQVQGFNFLKDLHAGVAMWSTGTGKTALAAGLLKYHTLANSFDTGFFVVKAHNKINTQRALERLVDLDSVVIDGSKKTRRRRYEELRDGEIVVINYEKFRTDQEELAPFFDDRRILSIWDEMPTKLKNRTTQLYMAICECLYSTNPPQVNSQAQRPSEMRHYMLSATPIENDPEDWFNCVRLMDPTIYGTVSKFRKEFVKSYSFFDKHKPERWHRLDKLGLKAAHITHQVDKNDPDIAKQFPDVTEEPYYVDWGPNRKIYDKILKQADLDAINPVALITVLQMMCDAPTMLTHSADTFNTWLDMATEWDGDPDDLPDKAGSMAAWNLVQSLDEKITNRDHMKLNALRELLCDTHPHEKIVVFSAFNEGLLPILEDCLQEWNIAYVRYSGTPKQRQDAQDAFTDDPSIRVFLSSDMGSDSINLEAGSVVVHYDLPWKWSTKIQRQNRIHRVTSEFSTVRYYTLMMANSVEDRKAEIIAKKMAYHDGVFKGAIADHSASARMTREDLLYILTG